MLSIFNRIAINYLLVNLAVADILYVVFISPKVFSIQFSFTILPDGVTGTVLCKFFTTGTVAWVGAASSILTLAVVAIERYYAVVYPLGNKQKITMDTLKVSQSMARLQASEKALGKRLGNLGLTRPLC